MPGAYATNVAGIFAGGDILGAGLMIKAMADGRKAAVAIDCYLQGKELPPELPEPYVADIKDTYFRLPRERRAERGSRSKQPLLPSKSAKGTKEINLGFPDKETCVKEARRCLTCRCTSIRY